ncbi:hypothetical protein [Halostagnicola larsenii]|uniref:hypothetical protein n=1 Tax=Halostagnicola larsenii TaxID=353800 RepID=UPI0006799C2C
MSDRSNARGPASAADERPKGLYGSSAPKSAQRRALTGGDLPVAVYGLGKMGLPLATVYAETTTNVIGVDVDPAVVEAVSSGRCHVRGEPGLAEGVQSAVDADWLEATTNGSHAASRGSGEIAGKPTNVGFPNRPNQWTILPTTINNLLWTAIYPLSRLQCIYFHAQIYHIAWNLVCRTHAYALTEPTHSRSPETRCVRLQIIDTIHPLPLGPFHRKPGVCALTLVYLLAHFVCAG